ncbi:hypothetical protein [Methylocaldum szegediense]|uniref:hypothetical protein n=1 Tax=Methylocaldum szegediense TaxID=73780 RepID=UPI00041D5C86
MANGRALFTNFRSIEMAFVDQGYTGDQAAEAARQQGIRLIVVKLSEAKSTFALVLAWVAALHVGWIARFRCSARDVNDWLKH